MSQEVFQTTTEDLLTSIVRKIRAYQKHFRGLRPESVGIGFLGFSPRFPAVSISPSIWQKVGVHSDRRFNVGRQIEVQFFDSGSSNDEVQTRIRGYLESFVEMLVNDDGYFFEDSSHRKLIYGYEFLPFRFTAIPTQVSQTYVRTGVLPLTLFSRDYLPVRINQPKFMVKVRDDAVFKYYCKRIWDNRNSRLKEVREFRRESSAPKLGGVTITSELISDSIDRRAAGSDSHDFQFQTTVWTKFLPGNKSLLTNVRITEKLKDILHEDVSLGGRVWNSFVQSIEFDVDNQENPNFYVSRINFIGRKHKSTLFGNK